MTSWRGRAPDRERIVLGLLAVTVAVVVFANGWGVLTPDTKPEIFLAPWRSARDFAGAWLDAPELGSPSFSVGLSPIAFVMAVVESVGVPAWAAQKLWRAALLILAGWGARKLYAELAVGTPAATAAGRIAAAVAYGANPYVIVGGGTTPTLLPYAVLPLVVVAWLRAVRGSGWRWSAAAALALMCASGINAGVVAILQLVVVVPVAIHLVVTARDRLPRFVIVLAQTAVLYTALSLYWLLPAVFALSRGATVTANTESLAAINIAASFAEVFRGLGMWTLYGSGAQGPFTPGQLAYLSAPVIVVLTFVVPVVALLGPLLSRSPARVFGTSAALTGALLMAAPFPFESRSAWGDLVVGVLDAAPGATAFRTLNKAGAVLEIGLAILIGLAVSVLVPHLRQRARAAAAIAAAGSLVVASTAPAWTGGLFPVRLDVPDYWASAAGHVNDLGATQAPGRVLITPGIKLADYTWGYGGPDELGNSLFERPNVFRSTTFSSSPEAAELLAETDRRLQLGVLPLGAMSAMARLVGVGVVVGRYDTALTPSAPEYARAALRDDPGLGAARTFGTAAGGAAVTVQVAGPAGPGSAGVRALVPAVTPLLLDGSGAALPDVVSAGLDPMGGTVLLAGALDDDQLAAAVGDGAHLVLTDSNARRVWSTEPSLTGPLVGAQENLPGLRALYGPDDQTVAVADGNVRVAASGPGQLFGPFPIGDASLALDGDPSTAWLFGNFRTAAGNALTISFEEPVRIGPMQVRSINSGGIRLTQVRVTADGPDGQVSTLADLSEWVTFPAALDLGNRRVSRIRIEPVATSGVGDGWVGISEVSIPGVELTKVARTPIGLSRRLTGSDLGANDLSVLLHRRSGDRFGENAEEPRLERDVTLPDARRFVVSGTVRIAHGATDQHIDDLIGADPQIRATSTSRAFGNPALRAAAAVDGSEAAPDLGTGWIPAEPVVGESIAVDFPARDLREFRLTQNAEGGLATSALISINDAEPFPTQLQPGVTTIRLPQATRASRVRVLITGRSGVGPTRILDLGLPHPNPADASLAAATCVSVATIDGAPLRVRLQGERADLLGGQPVPFTACEGTQVALAAGVHRIRSLPEFAVDDLRLRSRGSGSQSAAVNPEYRVDQSSPHRVKVTLTADCAPCYFSSGQGFDPRWAATHNGSPLGAPTVADAYAAAWRVNARAGDTVEAAYAGATPSRLGWLVSALAVLLSLGLWRGRPLRRLWRRPEAVAASAPTVAQPADGVVERPAQGVVAQPSQGMSAVPSVGPPVMPAVATPTPARLALAALVAILVALTVGPIPGLVTAGLLAATLLRPRWPAQMLLVAAVTAAISVPLAWYVGPSDPAKGLAVHVAGNLWAHQLAGTALWLAFLGTLSWRHAAIDPTAPRAGHRPG